MEEEDDDEDEDKPFNWKEYPLGSVQKGKITNITDYGALVQFTNGSLGFAQSPLHTEGIELEEGQEVEARILDVGISLHLYNVTLNSSFMPTTDKVTLPSNCITDGTVVVKTDGYVILCLSQFNNTLCYCKTSSFNSLNATMIAEFGTTISVKIMNQSSIGQEWIALHNAFKEEVPEQDIPIITAFYQSVVIGIPSATTTQEYKPNDKVIVSITVDPRTITQDYLYVKINNNDNGIIYVTDVNPVEKWTSYPFHHLNQGDKLEGTILGIDEKHSKGSKKVYVVTLRKDIDAIQEFSLQKDDMKYCFISGVTSKYLIVRFNYNCVWTVGLKYCSDNFIVDPSKAFKVGQVVMSRILGEDERNRMIVSLRKTDITGQEKITYYTIQVGNVYEGIVSKIEDSYILVRIEHSGVCVFIPKNECSDNTIHSLSELYKKKDRVKVCITEKEKKKCKGTLRESKIHEREEPEDTIEVNEGMKEEEEIDEEMIPDFDEDEENEGMKEEEEEPVNVLLKKTKDSDDDESESDDDDDEGATFDWNDLEAGSQEAKETESTVLTEKKKKKRLNEKQIAEIEENLAKNEALPQSDAEYEKLLLSNPYSSHLWLRYASWLLSITEVTKAKAVLRKALKSIPSHMEEERNNIWLALMNLESEYGDEDSLETLYKEVKQNMEPKKVSMHLISIYETKKQYANAVNIYKQLVKENKEDVDIWSGWCELFFKQDQMKEAGEILKRSLTVLNKNEKTMMLKNYAVLLYRYHHIDEGRTVFEDLLSKLPKRHDLWNVYIDQETKAGNFDFVRSLFKRMVEIKTSVNKVKSIFKKWISFEDAHGDEKTVAEVEAMVQEYINRLSEE